MARMKFLCDAERCIECNACVTACKNEHEVPWGINRRRVVTINDGKPGERSISVACMHCSDAPCMAVCPVDCFYQTEGVVLHSKDLCIGCGYCFYACPFGAPQFPQAGNFGSRGKMDKCTFCAGGPEEANSTPSSRSTAATAWPRASCRSAPKCAPPRPCLPVMATGVGHLPRARGGPWLRLRCLGLGQGLPRFLSGCYEAASDKPLMYKKGEYIGKKDEELSSEARDKLRSRMSIQGSGSL
jgi:Fe-S-cluster-containing dehydrogenase component